MQNQTIKTSYRGGCIAITKCDRGYDYDLRGLHSVSMLAGFTFAEDETPATLLAQLKPTFDFLLTTKFVPASSFTKQEER